MMSITIRLATHADVPILQSLIPLSVRELSAKYYNAVQIEAAILHIFGVDTQLIDDGTYFVAETDGVLVGCGGWSKRRTLFGGDQLKIEPDALLNPAVDAARIRAFFVHPNWARQGIGRKIIAACESAIRVEGFQTIELMATLPGEPLYAAMGYVVTQSLEIPMPNGATLPAKQMVKHITAS